MEAIGLCFFSERDGKTGRVGRQGGLDQRGKKTLLRFQQNHSSLVCERRTVAGQGQEQRD